MDESTITHVLSPCQTQMDSGTCRHAYNKLGGYMMVWHMLYIPHVLSLLLVVKLAVAHMWPQLSSFVLHQSGRMM